MVFRWLNALFKIKTIEKKFSYVLLDLMIGTKKILGSSHKTEYFAITVSPPLRQADPKYLYNEDVYELRRWFNTFSQYYMLYPEFDMKSRLHYHGVIRVNDWIKLHKTKHRISRLIGWIDIKPLMTFRDHLKWLIYCRKHKCHLTPFYFKSLKEIKIQQAVVNDPLDNGIMKFFARSASSSSLTSPHDNGGTRGVPVRSVMSESELHNIVVECELSKKNQDKKLRTMLYSV